MEEYGLIGGNTVNFMAEKINQKSTSGEIVGVASWAGIDHFQHALKGNLPTIRRLEKIMVIDGAFIAKDEDLNDRDVARRALSDFLHLEGLVKRDLDGVYLVLYTKSPVLNAYLKRHYEKDSITKYSRTVNLLTTNGYQASGMARVLGTMYTSMDEDEGKIVGHSEESEIKKRVAEQAEIYKLIGQREEIRSQVDILNKRMDLVDRQLNGYLMGDRNDDLDVVSELITEKQGASVSLTDEIESLLNG